MDVEGQSSCELLDNTLSFALRVPRPVASLLLLAKSPAKYAKPSSSLSRPRSSLQLRGVLWDLRHRLLRGNAMRREGAVPVDLASEVHGSRNRQEPGFGRKRPKWSIAAAKQFTQVPDDSPPPVPRNTGEFSCAATAVTEAENTTRESGIGKSQGGACCMAVSLVRKGFAWSACPAEESDWHR